MFHVKPASWMEIDRRLRPAIGQEYFSVSSNKKSIISLEKNNPNIYNEVILNK